MWFQWDSSVSLLCRVRLVLTALKVLRARVGSSRFWGALLLVESLPRVTVWSLAPLPPLCVDVTVHRKPTCYSGALFPPVLRGLCLQGTVECGAETYLILGNRENHRRLRESICIFVTARELHEQVELS